jgi:hypothetical protein
MQPASLWLDIRKEDRGRLAQFGKANLVAKLKHARDRKRAETGRARPKARPGRGLSGGPQASQEEPRNRPEAQPTTDRRSWQHWAMWPVRAALPYHANSVRQMLAKGTMPAVLMTADSTVTATLSL